MKKTNKIITIAALFGMYFISSCSNDKVKNPEPLDQEVITTLKLHVTDSTGFDRTFIYKVDNGFGQGTGTISIDTIKLPPTRTFNAEVLLLNEQVTPPENITNEVLQENTDHLFLYQSTGAGGGGTITTSNGSKDDNGAPFNQKITLTTINLGTGTLVITLKHEPTNKNAGNPSGAGGETDAQATFPVVIQ